MTIGEWIKDIRKQHNLTQHDFGLVMGVSKMTAFRWENMITIPNNDQIRKIANAFHLDADVVINKIKDGFISVGKERSDGLDEMEKLFNKLGEKGRKIVLDLMRDIIRVQYLADVIIEVEDGWQRDE